MKGNKTTHVNPHKQRRRQERLQAKEKTRITTQEPLPTSQPASIEKIAGGTRVTIRFLPWILGFFASPDLWRVLVVQN